MPQKRRHADPTVNRLLRAAHGLTSVFLLAGVVLLIAGVVEFALGILQTAESRYVGILLGLGLFFLGAVVIYVRSFVLAFAELFGRLVLATEHRTDPPEPPHSGGLIY